MSKTQRLLTVVGDSGDIATWSGIPYFFLRAGRQVGILDGGVALDPSRFGLRRRLWNLRSLVLRGKWGGYQYTPGFLRALFAQAGLDPSQPKSFITHFPLLPPAPLGRDWTVTHYIDATLKQNFDDYGLGRHVSRRLQQETLARERDAFQGAQYVVCMSRWAAAVVRDFYGVPEARCRVILPGANLVEESLEAPQGELSTPKMDPLRLGFIGKDWERKGLLRLLDIASSLDRRGVRCEVVIVGPKPEELPRHPLVRSAGFIHKHREMAKFTELVRSFHFGFLLSSVEALGISTLECLRLGVPAVGTPVGGIVDAIPEGLGYFWDPRSGLDEIVSTLEHHAKNPDAYAALRQRVAARADEFSWTRTAQAFSALYGERA